VTRSFGSGGGKYAYRRRDCSRRGRWQQRRFWSRGRVHRDG